MNTPKRKLSSQRILADMRAGLNDAELSTKYDIPMVKMELVFKKLVKIGAISPEELEIRKNSAVRSIPPGPWKCPACGMAQDREFFVCPRCAVVESKPVLTRPPLGMDSETMAIDRVSPYKKPTKSYRRISRRMWFTWGAFLCLALIVSFTGPLLNSSRGRIGLSSSVGASEATAHTFLSATHPGANERMASYSRNGETDTDAQYFQAGRSSIVDSEKNRADIVDLHLDRSPALNFAENDENTKAQFVTWPAHSEASESDLNAALQPVTASRRDYDRSPEPWGASRSMRARMPRRDKVVLYLDSNPSAVWVVPRSIVPAFRAP